MATIDTERYVRIMLLTFEGGTWISREILLKEVDRIPGSPSLAEFIRTQKKYLKRKRQHREINSKQYKLLFPSNGGTMDEGDWDLSLLVKIIMFFFSQSLSGKDSSELTEILQIRNDVICHASQPAINEREFFSLWTRLTNSLHSLAFNQETKQYTGDLIAKFSQGPLDIQSSVEKLGELCRNDEHMEQVLAAVSRLERGHDQIAVGVASANAKLDEIINKLLTKDLEVGTCKVEVPILDSRVCIIGQKEEVVQLAADIVLKVLKSSIDKADNPVDDENVKNAVEQFLTDIRNKDAVAVSADQGSIILNIKCLTLHALVYILGLFRTNNNRYRLLGLENALGDMFHEQLKVELVLPEETVERISIFVDACINDTSSLFLGDQPHKRELSMGIQCRSVDAAARVINYFHSGDSANRMNQLSEALSEAVNDKVRVEIQLDEQGFSEALKASVEAHLDEERVSKDLHSSYPAASRMSTIEENVKNYRTLICRCIHEPRVVSLLSPMLDPDESTRIKKLFNNNQEQGVDELIDCVLSSKQQGKWLAFLIAIRAAEFSHLADLLENKYCHNQNSEYGRKVIQIFSPELDKQLMVHDVISQMYACEIIAEVDKQGVLATLERKGNAYATMVLLERLQSRKSPEEWYGQFLKILHNAEYDHLVKSIEPDFLVCPSRFLPKEVNPASDSRMECEDQGGACSSFVNVHVVSEYMDTSVRGDNMNPVPAPPDRSDSMMSSSVDTKNSHHSPLKKIKLELKEEPDSDSDETNSLASDGKGDSNLQLRSYQLELAERAIKGENTIICAPTGSGKTWVALYIVEKHLQTFGDRSIRKVVFMAKTGTLIKQQADMFSTHLPDLQIKLIQGDADEAGMLGEFLRDSDVLCITPQILVNNLNSGSVKSLTQFSLLILDECHHTRGDDPYSVLMRKLLVEKYDDTRDEKLPQIVGLTASIGIGKSSTDVEARDYIMNVCALMDVKRLSVVKDCKEELRKYTSDPDEEIIPMSRLRDDPGKDILMSVIDETEDKLKDLTCLESSMLELVQRKCPKNKESQEYNKWAVDVMSATHQCIVDPDTSRNIRTCANYLYVYNQALEVNSLLQKIDVMKFLADKHAFEKQQKDKLTEFERELLGCLQVVQRKLGDIERENENPNVRRLSDTLLQMLENGGDESRVMVFVKARATCKALATFLNEDLNKFDVRPLFGKDNRGNEEGMTQAVQNETIQMFREGTYKVLVATSIGVEGIDVPACNMVLNYNYTGNEITKIQMKGRIRKHGGRNVIIGDANMVQREKVNAYKEGIMKRAVQLYENLSIQTIENKTALIQKDEMKKYKMKMELEKAKRLKQTNTGDYEIRCKRCNEFACYFSDIRKIEPHHIVIDREFDNRVDKRPVKPPIPFEGFISNFKIICKKCPQEWGVLAEKDGCSCHLLKLAKLKFINRETSRIEPFKRWIDIPVNVPEMTAEDFPQLFGPNVDA